MLQKIFLTKEIYFQQTLFGFLVMGISLIFDMIWIDESPLINIIIAYKEDCVNNDAKISDLIDNTKR